MWDLSLLSSLFSNNCRCFCFCCSALSCSKLFIADCSSSRLITFAVTPGALTTAVSQRVGLRVPDTVAAAAGFGGSATLSRWSAG